MEIFQSINKNNNDSSPINFNLSVVTSHTCSLNQTISIDDGRLQISMNYPQFDGTVEVINCNGLIQLKHLLESMSSQQAIITGRMQRGGKWVESGDLHWINPDLEYYEPIEDNADEYFRYQVDQPSLICFDVPNSLDSSDRAWEQMCDIDPQLSGVGYVVTSYPSNLNIDKTTRRQYFGGNGYRFYCIAKNGADIPRYGRNFAMRSSISGFSYIEQNTPCFYSIYQNINAKYFCPGQVIVEAPAVLAERLVQMNDPIDIKAGGTLDTEKFTDLNACENEAFVTRMLYYR